MVSDMPGAYRAEICKNQMKEHMIMVGITAMSLATILLRAMTTGSIMAKREIEEAIMVKVSMSSSFDFANDEFAL